MLLPVLPPFTERETKPLITEEINHPRMGDRHRGVWSLATSFFRSKCMLKVSNGRPTDELALLGANAVPGRSERTSSKSLLLPLRDLRGGEGIYIRQTKQNKTVPRARNCRYPKMK